jgi:pimeloyl-ACP methyl ester carboxylesterase
VVSAVASFQLLAQAKGKERAVEYPTLYRTTQIDGLSIFYREAGPKDAPTILLLHGLPSSSRMFEPLLTRLAGQFHMVAPDYPGFGHSDAPISKEFSYTFDNIAKVMDHFAEALHLTHYTLYMQDYGGPVGFRMALAHTDRVEALIVQDAVAHNEGLGANWKTRRAFWSDRASHEAALRSNLLSLDATRTRHVGNDPNPEKYDPDLWADEYAFLNKPGEADIQSDLFYDYRTNVGAYKMWQAWMQKTQPRLLVLWGKYDLSFELTEPEAYRRDIPKAQVHILDAGHFALDTAADEIADLIGGFLSNKPGAMMAGAVGAKTSNQEVTPIFVTEIPPGYRDWRLISVAHEAGNLNDIRAILGNEIAIQAYREGTLPFPEGTIIARVAWSYVSSEENNKIFGRSQSFVAGPPTNGVQFMVKDSNKYASTGGWGYAHFNDAKPAGEAALQSCFPCHQAIKSRDFIFTRYSP